MSAITLFVDESAASADAERLLRNAEIPYERIAADGGEGNLPTAYYGWVSYPKVSGIMLLIRMLEHVMKVKSQT